MTCFICGSKDREISTVGQFWVRKCEKCGFYGLRGELISELEEQNKRFDVARTQAFLSERAQQQLPPWITEEDVLAHQLVEL